ncbi:MAG: glycosyltransferase [Bryobacteraceae bacterium]|nr:glycosyltransferase [Bryobacteraceae bacterium]
MRALVLGMGSAGDVHPMAALGIALRSRGHEVEFAASPVFRRVAERHGFGFFPLGTEQDYFEALNDPDLWKSRRAFGVIARRLMLPSLRPVYEWIERSLGSDDMVVVAAATALGARVAQDKLGASLATIHLQPAIIRSYYQTAAIGIPDVMNVVPRPLKRLFFRVVDRFVIDRALAPEVNRFRSELGLPSVRRLFNGWIHSPQLVIGLFPEWFGPVQPDWPPNMRLAGFPLYDESEARGVPDELEEFLRDGEPPVVFTAGSAMTQARDFFRVSAEAVAILGLRAVFLTQFPEQLPPSLPGSIRSFSYVPFSLALPRAAALVHHGGIGTTAQAFAAGIPQLVVPYAHDQPDNAVRVERLGAGLTLLPAAYRTSTAARTLRRLLGSDEIRSTCRRLAQATPRGSLAVAAHLIERLAMRGVRFAAARPGAG